MGTITKAEARRRRPEKDRNIALLGFMGTGKSTVARLLARQLGRKLVDMDRVIERRAGKSIADIFAQDGKPHFRWLERALVQELAARRQLVIACGGGVVLNPDNIRDLQHGGLVVCLTAAPDVILRRVAAARHRPLLEGGAKRKKLLALLATRQPLYDHLPHRIDTTALTPAAVAKRLLALAGGRTEPAAKSTAY